MNAGFLCTELNLSGSKLLLELQKRGKQDERVFLVLSTETVVSYELSSDFVFCRFLVFGFIKNFFHRLQPSLNTV